LLVHIIQIYHDAWSINLQKITNCGQVRTLIYVLRRITGGNTV